jgi:hypothetical protein
MGAAVYAKGRYSIGYCMRSGRKMRLKDMVFDGEYPWMLVDPRWKEIRHPQERLKPKPDPVALKRPATDVEKAAANELTLLAVTPPLFDELSSSAPYSAIEFQLGPYLIEVV